MGGARVMIEEGLLEQVPDGVGLRHAQLARPARRPVRRAQRTGHGLCFDQFDIVLRGHRRPCRHAAPGPRPGRGRRRPDLSRCRAWSAATSIRSIRWCCPSPSSMPARPTTSSRTRPRIGGTLRAFRNDLGARPPRHIMKRICNGIGRRPRRPGRAGLPARLPADGQHRSRSGNLQAHRRPAWSAKPTCARFNPIHGRRGLRLFPARASPAATSGSATAWAKAAACCTTRITTSTTTSCPGCQLLGPAGRDQAGTLRLSVILGAPPVGLRPRMTTPGGSVQHEPEAERGAGHYDGIADGHDETAGEAAGRKFRVTRRTSRARRRG